MFYRVARRFSVAKPPANGCTARSPTAYRMSRSDALLIMRPG
jgi:hypothetical protein